MLRSNKKKVILTTVEEQTEQEDDVIRLGAEKEAADTMPLVRIGPAKVEVEAPSEASSKDFRTHQPDIDDLIDKPLTQDLGDAELPWGEEAETRPARPWGWFALAGVILAAGVLWSLLALKESGKVKETVRVKTEEAIIDEAAEIREAETLVTSIESAMRAYFTASTIESRLRWVRFPTRVEPMMREHEKTHPVTPSPLQSVRVLQPLSIEGRTDFWMASVMLASGERHELVIETTEAGPRIDWETMVCHQPMPWDEFATKRPPGKSMDFRLHVQTDTFYSHEFHDETQWTCYRLSAPDSEEIMFGYVQRGSAVEAAITPHINGVRHASLLLRLQIPEGLQSKMGVVIEQVISPRWLLLTPPDQKN